MRKRSSVAEQPTLNRQRGGSSPLASNGLSSYSGRDVNDSIVSFQHFRFPLIACLNWSGRFRWVPGQLRMLARRIARRFGWRGVPLLTHEIVSVQPLTAPMPPHILFFGNDRPRGTCCVDELRRWIWMGDKKALDKLPQKSYDHPPFAFGGVDE